MNDCFVNCNEMNTLALSLLSLQLVSKCLLMIYSIGDACLLAKLLNSNDKNVE